MARLSVLIPVFREKSILREMRARLRAALSPITEDFEVIFIDDGSTDGSWEAIRSLSSEDGRFRGLKFSRNFGQHVAITAGLDACDGDWVVVMDGDLQDRPEVIPDLYAKAQEGYDIVFVSRQQRPESLLYLFATRLFFKIFKFLANTDYDPSYGNFSIVSRKVVEHYRQFGESLRFYGGILYWLGFERTSIPAARSERFAGRPAYTLAKRLRFAADIILAHSDRPLYLSIVLGLWMSIVSLVAGAYIFVRAAFWNDFAVQGWPSVIVAIFFSGGIILVVLGIIGIYIGKIFNELKHRPLYVVADRAGLDPP